jgi:hypothetical protein
LNKKLVGNIGIDQIAGGAITYNHLNLPQTITAKKDDGVSLKGTIAYTYDAAGNKLKKTVTDNTINPPKVTTTLYISGFEYKNDTLQQVAHEEGRIRSVSGRWPVVVSLRLLHQRSFRQYKDGVDRRAANRPISFS